MPSPGHKTLNSVTLLPLVALVVLLSVFGTFWVLAGWTGLAYLGLFLLLGVPGLPLGFALFGRRHPAGWLAGLTLGYALTSLVWWTVVFQGYATTPAFVTAWAAAAVAARLGTRRFTSPLVAAPAWTRRDTTALCLLLLMVPALVALPFSKLGSEDRDGNRLYRAYFVADFVWHTALTAELAKHEPRPRNPFLAPEPLHYYWTYFRIPATIAAQTGLDVQTALKLNATGTAFLFLAAIYLAAWAALPAWPFTTAVAVTLTFLGPSAEGLAAIVDLLRRGHSLAELRDLNIDAVASWAFKGLRIDNLPRAMWYNPQHSFSCALGLLAVPVAIWGGIRARAAAIVLAGCALGASLAFNPLLGVAFCGVYGVTMIIATVTGRAAARDLVRHGFAVVPVALAFAWCTFNQVGDGAGEALVFGLTGLARNATVLNLALQLGPLMIPMAIGLWPKGAEAFVPIWPALAGVTLGLLLMHLVALTVNPAWVGFRGGQIFLVLAPAIVARGLARLWKAGSRRWAVATAAVVVIAGFPTSIVDLYNTQDVTNRGLSPGAEFHWTVLITPLQQEALDWIRTNTPPHAVVQAEPTIRGRETWSLIPTFGERRMATGNPLALLPVPEYAEKNARVKAIYASSDPQDAWQEAKNLGIDYLYVDATERAAYPGVGKFDANPDLFAPVFKNAEAVVFALRP